MKHFILLVCLLFGMVFFSFSPSLKKTKNSYSLLDTIKGTDSIFLDTIALDVTLYQKSANACYYHDKFNGRKTASGAIFNNSELTCAHKKLPFGTLLKVTSLQTGKSVIVKVTDRGPFSKGKDIDLSKKAFKAIAPKRYGGHIAVSIEIIK